MSDGFRQHVRQYGDACRAILGEGSSGVLDEAAFPAYAERNPLMRWLFWERIRRVAGHVASGPRRARILDFGCGGGALLPLVAPCADEVVAADIELLPLRRMAERLPLPANVQPRDLTREPLDALVPGSVDLVVALDVLEHVEDLEGTIAGLFRVLRPSGELVVSGPTENLAYRIGRWAAGPVYSGAYHVRGIDEIREALERTGRVVVLATLIPPVPLFRILTVTRRAHA